MIHDRTTVERVALSQETRVILPPLNKKVDMDAREAFDYTKERQDDPYFCPLGTKCKNHVQVQEEQSKIRVATSIREVQLLVTSSGAFFWALDTYPETIGPNRLYKLAPLPSGVPIIIKLLPDQWIVAAVESGRAIVGIIIEYHQDTRMR